MQVVSQEPPQQKGSHPSSQDGERHRESCCHLHSKVRISGFGSNTCCAGPDLRLAGIALSINESRKSRTMKSLPEKSSREKLGPFGNKARDPDPARSIFAIGFADERRDNYMHSLGDLTLRAHFRIFHLSVGYHRASVVRAPRERWWRRG